MLQNLNSCIGLVFQNTCSQMPHACPCTRRGQGGGPSFNGRLSQRGRSHHIGCRRPAIPIQARPRKSPGPARPPRHPSTPPRTHLLGPLAQGLAHRLQASLQRQRVRPTPLLPHAQRGPGGVRLATLYLGCWAPCIATVRKCGAQLGKCLLQLTKNMRLGSMVCPTCVTPAHFPAMCCSLSFPRNLQAKKKMEILTPLPR